MTELTKYEVPFCKLKKAFTAEVPGSKSLSNRAVIAAALCDSPVELLRPLASDDTEVAMQALKKLGVNFEVKEDRWLVDGKSFGEICDVNPELYLGNAGTAVRFLSSVLCAKGIACTVTGIERMHERPIDILLKGLNDLGANIESINGNGCPPLRIAAQTLKGGKTSLSGQVSSQYFSGLMMALPLAKQDSVIEVSDEWISKPYIEMTANMLKAFGISLKIKEKTIEIPGMQKYTSPGTYRIEPDATAASYPLGLAVLHRIPVTMEGLGAASLQGDVQFVNVLERMGCEVKMDKEEIFVHVKNELKPIKENLNHIPDAAMTLVVLCSTIPGKSELTGLRNLKFKECDRLQALTTELKKMGANINCHDDGFIIEGKTIESLNPALITTYDDHRMAMCLSLLGTQVKGTVIEDPDCVRKTYPNYWQDLAKWIQLAS